MNRRTKAILALAMLVCSVVPAQSSDQIATPDRADDEAAIRAVFAANEAAVNQRDPVAFAAQFSPDGDAIFFDSPKGSGRTAIERLFREAWADVPLDRQVTISVENIRFPDSDTAIADAVANFSAGEPARDRGIAVMVRRDGRWQIAALRLFPAQHAEVTASTQAGSHLWGIYRQSLMSAKYIDLTHTLTPSIPVWKGFGASSFGPALNPENGKPYRYDQDGFEATSYSLATDQFGTQLDPPAHWAPEYPSIDELPATYAIRPLAIISIVEEVAADPGYSLQVADIEAWERRNGRIPAGSVVMIRSDWSRAWPDSALARQAVFPGVSLPALKFLHEQRHILFHGHEPLDTDMTPTLEGEHWLMHHGYTQAEGVANLDKVPETGCLITIGYPKFKGGLGGYARYVAICPADWRYGVSVGEVAEAPLPRSDKTLQWDADGHVRVRK